jgi:hypothetical protein
LLDRGGQGFGILLTFTIEKVCRESAIRKSGGVGLFDIPFVVRLKGLLELNLLRIASGMLDLGLDTEELLGFGRRFVEFTGGPLPPTEVYIYSAKRLPGRSRLTFFPRGLTSAHAV